MESGQAAELAVFIICVSILLIYNILYFTTFFQKLKFKFRHRHYLNLWGLGAEARSLWAGAMMADEKEGITAAQTIRNMVLGVSILAGGVTLLASQLLLLLTDSARLEQIAKYSRNDPISGSNSLMGPELKLGIALAVLFVALITMTQCVRLSVHLSFLLRAVPIDPKRSVKFSKIALAINRRSSLFFSLGLRIQYAFFPLFLYVLGPLVLLISTLFEVGALFLMDLTPDDLAYSDNHDETEEQVEEEIVHTTSMRLIPLTEGENTTTTSGDGLKPRAPYVNIE
jgi:uncharacterized membrane protein